MVQEEGLENAWARHQQNHLALRSGLEALGIEFLVAEQERLPQLNSVYIPQGVDDAQVRTRLLNEFDLEIGAGLGALAGKVWRIGLMGHASSSKNVDFCLNALKAVL
jgi:alanine-glyoxylate transaminase/serine-glyoxylate transaminase/serine-pyruvate transaminase